MNHELDTQTILSTTEAIILGLVQGLTEFLPISSSGHLALFQLWFGIQPSELILFNVLLHVGTLAAVVYFYRKDVLDLLRAVPSLPGEISGTIRQKETLSAEAHACCAILIGTFVTGVFAIVLKDFLESLFDRPAAIGGALIATGILLYLTKILGVSNRTPDGDTTEETGLNQICFWHAAVLGLAQGIAITPGLSRSGTTIAVALLLGLRREPAVKFSFLLSLPAILGACLLEMKDGLQTLPVLPALLGTLVSFVSGLFFLWTLVWIIRAGRFHVFAYYTIPVGAATLIYAFMH